MLHRVRDERARQFLLDDDDRLPLASLGRGPPLPSHDPREVIEGFALQLRGRNVAQHPLSDFERDTDTFGDFGQDGRGSLDRHDLSWQDEEAARRCAT